MNIWEVWLADFPFEDLPNQVKERPVIILNTEPLCILATKVTTHNVRASDDYDVEIIEWKEAGLKQPSVARISKTISLNPQSFKHKIGDLSTNDQIRIMPKYIQYLINTNQIQISEPDSVDEDTDNTIKS